MKFFLLFLMQKTHPRSRVKIKRTYFFVSFSSRSLVSLKPTRQQELRVPRSKDNNVLSEKYIPVA